MDKFVIKRNGQYLPFEAYKIEEAIQKAFNSVSENYNTKVTEKVFKLLQHKDTWAVEDIQDTIEKVLFEYAYYEVMRSFMLYRHTRKLQREHVLGLNEDTTYV